MLSKGRVTSSVRNLFLGFLISSVFVFPQLGNADTSIRIIGVDIDNPSFNPATVRLEYHQLVTDYTNQVSQITANGAPVAFTNAIPSGASYTVTIVQEPTSPHQPCTLSGVTEGQGKAYAHTEDIKLFCSSYTIGGSVAFSGPGT